MKARRAPLFALFLALTGVFASAQSPTRETYNVLSTPLDDLSRELLVETGYIIREDGKVWDKIADNAVRLDEMNTLLARLAGARRLKALLELNLILNRSEGEKKLTTSEREAVRAILRKHWAVFGVGTRKDFRTYFSVQEHVEELDKIPVRFDRGSAMLMRDPDPNTAPSTALAAAPVSVTAPPPAAIDAPVPILPPEPEVREVPRQFVPRSVLTPFLEPLSLRRPSPFAPRVKPAPSALRAEGLPVIDAPAPVYAQRYAAPAPAPVAGPSLMAGLTPLPPPQPMVFAPQTPLVSTPPPALRAEGLPVIPAPAPSPSQVDVAPLPPATVAPPPPLFTPPPAAVTSAPPVAPARRQNVQNTPVPAAAAPPTNSLFGTTLPAAPSAAADLGAFKPWTPSEAEPPALRAEGSPVIAAAPPMNVPTPQPVAVPAVKLPPAPADATQSDYDAFVANGPYGREGQQLLKMLAEKAPEFCRAILRRTIVRGAPLVVFDGARAGSDRRAGFAAPEPGRGVTIALSAGPVLVERKKGMFAKSLIALPEDPRAWAEIGVAPPALDALRKDLPPSTQETGPWGAVRAFADRSRRGTYTPQEQAGELLERLLLLGLEREGFGSSTYAARAWARAARLLFSARVAEDYGNDSFLDPDRRLELRDWIERGDESDDLMVASWSSSRGNVLDPRRGGPESQALYERSARVSCTRSLLADHLAEAARNQAARVRTIEALNDNDLLSASAAKAAAEKAAAEAAAARSALLASPPACDGRFGADEAGLRRSSALLAEVSRAERAFRERKHKGTAE